MAALDIQLKERELYANLTVSVQLKRDWRVRVGLVFLKIGIWLIGAQYVEEFPISILQNGEPVEME